MKPHITMYIINLGNAIKIATAVHATSHKTRQRMHMTAKSLETFRFSNGVRPSSYLESETR